ncbi:MAG TPA: winged helix-turn-helix domain-containing protein [Thermomicrobiales bacterium]|nr:winged helix-turn-helix domain-containing protein [Thermomicrobiales bacterium]
MGQLVVGRPAPKLVFAVSAPLELTSSISLTYRAGAVADGEHPGFDPWLIDAWRSLPAGLQHDLTLLLGFSGRLLYYIEELLFSFDALEPHRLDATYVEYLDHLQALPAVAYQAMAGHALTRIYQDRDLTELPPDSYDPNDWRMFLRPGITRANIDEAAAVVTSPEQLKSRTIALLDGFWSHVYAAQYEARRAELQSAVRHAQSLAHPTVQVTFSELTGHRLPEEIERRLDDIEQVVFCPSAHLGSFVQYIHYAPSLILYFDSRPIPGERLRRPRSTRVDDEPLDAAEVLEGLRAMSDRSRMKIIDMLRHGELYAQEVVGRLGISQSAVSRHLSTLESAHIITVRPANGMKYYAIDRERLRALAGYLDRIADGDDVPGHNLGVTREI